MELCHFNLGIDAMTNVLAIGKIREVKGGRGELRRQGRCLSTVLAAVGSHGALVARELLALGSLTLGLMRLALTTLVLVGAAPAKAQVVTTCGCSGSPVVMAEALENDDVSAVVQAYVALAEGSPRAKGPGVHPDQEHPHPWIRYLMVVEKSWKKELESFWIERPWGRCGSPLRPGYRYLLTLPAKEDTNAGVISGEPALTVGNCQEVKILTPASLEETAALGAPKSEFELSPQLTKLLPERLRQISAARGHCKPTSGTTKEVSMVPGAWSEMKVKAPSIDETWHIGQNGSSPDGFDEVVVFAHNPGPCWLRVRPEVSRRWAPKGSARRVLSGAGLTFREGWVPPYWSGSVSVGQDLPWIREAIWKIEPHPSSNYGPPGGLWPLGDASSPNLRLEKLSPPSGAYVNENTKIRISLNWRGEIGPGKVAHVAPVFEAKDQSLVTAVVAGEPKNQQFSAAIKQIEFEFTVTASQAARLRKPLQLRFTVEKRSGDLSKEGELIDSSKPIELLWGTQPEWDPVPPPEKGAWYAGGDGSTCLDAIIVRGVGSIQEGIAAERAWWRKEYPGSEMLRQSVSSPVGDSDVAANDHIHLKLASGEEKQLCFDITEFWSAPARPQRHPPP